MTLPSRFPMTAWSCDCREPSVGSLAGKGVGNVDNAGSGISFLCRSHQRGEPVVTMHEQQWAYCQGGFVDGQDGHLWAPIAPMTISELKWKQVGFVREVK
jgi:hypothetical protein